MKKKLKKILIAFKQLIKGKPVLRPMVVGLKRVERGVPVILTQLNGIDIKFVCESPREESRIEQYSRLSKEPETYEWIDRFVKPGDVFYDLGSNTGGYSLYVGKKYQNMKIFGFDPDVQNICQFNKNIMLNNLATCVSAFCICIADCDSMAEMFMISDEGLFSAGHSGNMVNKNTNRDGEQKVMAKIGSLQLTIDTLIERFSFPCPNHIKIDVDGDEGKVIAGALKTLDRQEVKTILVELDYSNTRLIDIILGMGFVGFTHFENELYYEMEKIEHIPAAMGNKLFVRASMA
jgi:FkbM family methyltransferase